MGPKFDVGGRSLQQKADQTGNPAHGPPSVAEREPRRRMAHSGHHRSRCTTGAVHHHHRRHPRRRVDRPIRLHSPAQQRFHRTRQAVGPEEFGRHTAHRAGGQPARISDEIQVLSGRSRPQQTVSRRPRWLNHPEGRPSDLEAFGGGQRRHHRPSQCRKRTKEHAAGTLRPHSYKFILTR